MPYFERTRVATLAPFPFRACLPRLRPCSLAFFAWACTAWLSCSNASPSSDSATDASSQGTGTGAAGTNAGTGGQGNGAGATNAGTAGTHAGTAGTNAGTAGTNAGAAGSAGTGGTSGGAGGTAAGAAGTSGGTGGAHVGAGGRGNGAGGSTGGVGGKGAADSGSGAGGAAGTNMAPDAGEGVPAVRFVGRFDTRDSAKPRFTWSGTGIIARFSGTQVGVKLTGGQQYTVLLDGALQAKMVTTDATYSIAKGLSAGPHTVEIYRRTEANQGEAQFLGFDFGGGELLAPPAPPSRRLEVIGDSITCGYGDEGTSQDCKFSPDTENHYLTYEAITARDLGADLSTIAISGIGVVCNYGDDATSCTHPMPEYYDRTLQSQADSVWDFGSWQPHAVVINLGTNDFSTSQDPTEQQFETAYQSFLEHIRSKYSDALILCTVAPLLSGSDLTTAKGYIANAVKKRNDAGDKKVKVFDISPLDSGDGYGCDWHPNLTTHRKMAAELTAELKSELGW